MSRLRRPRRSCGEQLAQHVLQDAAVAVVLDLQRRVDAHARVEAIGSPVGRLEP